MVESDRWRLALRAHAAEHAAMHERGLSRIGISGRPRLTQPLGFLPRVPWGPRGARPSARGMAGWEELTPGTKLALVGLGGLAAGVALVWGFNRAGISLF